MFWTITGWVLASGFALILIGWWCGELARDSHASAAAGFMGEARARGLSYGEAMQEWRLRAALVRLRREISDAALRKPEDWSTILVERTKAIAATLDSKAEGRTFIGIVSGLPLRDLFYEDAMELIHALPETDRRGYAPDPDLWDALRVTKQ